MAGYSTPYTFANYIGEWANDAAVLTEIRARKWDSTADGTGAARNGMEYYATGAHQMRMYVAGAWVATGTSVSSTLDFAYNASAGPAVITVDAGDVTWNQTGAFSFVVDVSACTGAADGFGVEDGTDYLRATHAAVNTLNLMGALGILNLAASGAATIDSDTVATFSGRSVAIDADGGPVDVDATGAVSINSSAGIINIGDDAVAQDINIGTGGAARTITIGNATGATAVDILSGTGGINLHDGIAQLDLDGAGALTETALVSADITPSGALTLRGGGVSQFGDDTGYFAFGGTGALTTAGITTADLDSSGAFSINSSAGVINIGDDAIDQDINIGTAGVRTIAIGSAAATAVNVDAITFSIDATTDSNMTVTGAAQSLALAVVGGGVQKLTIDSAGTGVDSIDITSSVGGIELNSALGVAIVGPATVSTTLGVTGVLTATSGVILGVNAAVTNGLSAYGGLLGRSSAQTVDCPMLVTGTTPNYWIMCENADYAFDFQHPQQTDPTLFIHSHNQATDEWIGFNHDGTNGVISVGTGTLSIPGTLTVTGLITANGGVALGGNDAVYSNLTVTGGYIASNSLQTVDCPMLVTGTTPNYWMMCENGDKAFDFAHAQQTNPTLFIHSANQATDEWVGFSHNQTNASYTRGTGVHEFDAVIRGATSLWRNYRQLGANSIGIGVTGATYIPPDPAGANASLGGLHLDNAPSDEYLHFEWDVHDDWDGVSDITVKIFFEQESAGGGGGQTTVFDLGVVYKQPNESTSKGQNLTESSITGAGAVKEQWVQTFTVVHNPGGGMDVEVNDLFTGTLWWDDVTSTDATHPIVNHIEIYYPSKQPALEA